MKDKLITCINPNKKVRVHVARTTELVEEARKIHGLSATASAALGRTLTASVIIGSMMKNDNDSSTITVKGDGPLGRMVTVADSKGHVKGYVENPQVDVPSKDGHLDVGTAVGPNGYLQVVQDLGLKEPYMGQVPLVDGEIGSDFAQYFYSSEQVESVVALGVLVDVDLSIKGAGGFTIQLMPGAEEEDIVSVEKAIDKLEPMSSMMARGLSVEDVALIMLAPLQLTILDEKDINYECDCSKERMERALYSLGKSDLEEMIEEDGKAEVNCHFCNTSHVFSKEELQAISDRHDLTELQ